MTIICVDVFMRGWADWRVSLTVLGWELALDAKRGCRPLLDLSIGREVE
nr:hypothetical protein [Brevundimonas diminuta]